MSIAILKTGETPIEMRATHGDFDDLFELLLREGGYDGEVASYDIVGGEALPAIDAHAAYLTTGSAAGVYENHPWLPPLLAFLRTLHEQSKPQVGICFGHQALALALGGEVGKSPKGWGVGRHEYDVVAAPEWLAKAREVRMDFAVAAMHQDQVFTKPEAAEIVGGNTFCPLGLLNYRNRAFSIQLHPEFYLSYATDLVRARTFMRYGEEIASLAIASLERRKLDNDRVGKWIVDFYRTHDAA